jgi:hypothetical protein
VASDKIRSFNRDTAWLATAVLSVLFLAALVIAVGELQTNARQAKLDFLPNAIAPTVESVVAKSASSNEKVNPGSGTGIDHALTERPLQELASSETESAASTPTSVLAFSPQKHRDAPQQDSAQTPVLKTRNVRSRSSVMSRFIGVKRRFIELWHQSLARRKSILRPKSSMSSIHRQYTSWLSLESEPANRCSGQVFCCY